MTDQQAEPTSTEHTEPPHLVVITTDGTVFTWPAAITGWHVHDDGDLTIHTFDPKAATSGPTIAVFARGQWTTAYEDEHLADSD